MIQVLSIKQVNKLREVFGEDYDMSDASMYYKLLPNGSTYLEITDEYKVPLFFSTIGNGVRIIPTYTLYDVLTHLPNSITIDGVTYKFVMWSNIIGYYNDDDPNDKHYANSYFIHDNHDKIDGALKLLLWCKEDGII